MAVKYPKKDGASQQGSCPDVVVCFGCEVGEFGFLCFGCEVGEFIVVQTLQDNFHALYIKDNFHVVGFVLGVAGTMFECVGKVGVGCGGVGQGAFGVVRKCYCCALAAVAASAASVASAGVGVSSHSNFFTHCASANGAEYTTYMGTMSQDSADEGRVMFVVGDSTVADGLAVQEGGGDKPEVNSNGMAMSDFVIVALCYLIAEPLDGNDADEDHIEIIEVTVYGEGGQDASLLVIHHVGFTYASLDGQDGEQAIKIGKALGKIAIEAMKQFADLGHSVHLANMNGDKATVSMPDDGFRFMMILETSDASKENDVYVMPPETGNQAVENVDAAKCTVVEGNQTGLYMRDYVSGLGQGANSMPTMVDEQCDEAMKGPSVTEDASGILAFYASCVLGGNHHGLSAENSKDSADAEAGRNADIEDRRCLGVDKTVEVTTSVQLGNAASTYDGGGDCLQMAEVSKTVSFKSKVEGHSPAMTDESTSMHGLLGLGGNQRMCRGSGCYGCWDFLPPEGLFTRYVR